MYVLVFMSINSVSPWPKIKNLRLERKKVILKMKTDESASHYANENIFCPFALAVLYKVLFVICKQDLFQFVWSLVLHYGSFTNGRIYFRITLPPLFRGRLEKLLAIL